jgi:hypothetical protein
MSQASGDFEIDNDNPSVLRCPHILSFSYTNLPRLQAQTVPLPAGRSLPPASDRPTRVSLSAAFVALGGSVIALGVPLVFALNRD